VEGEILGGEKMEERMIRQKDLTAECWSVQVWGSDYCNTCEFKDADECGGKNIRKTGKNKKGIDIPI